MVCQELNVPVYLHWNNRKSYNAKAFKKGHFIYRVGWKNIENPIEYPNCLTSLSCKWSKLIKFEDVLRITPTKLGDLVYHSTVEEINKIKISRTSSESTGYAGLHEVSCEIQHKPLECDYSHIEIQIVHSHSKDGNVEIKVYTHSDWDDPSCTLKSKKKFFKEIRGQYRTYMTAAFIPGKPQPQNLVYKIIPKSWIRFGMSLWLRLIEPIQQSQKKY